MALHRYEIVDRNGNVVGRQEHEHNFAPSLLEGQTARLTHINGQELSEQSAGVVGAVPDPLNPDNFKAAASEPVTVQEAEAQLVADEATHT